MTCPSDGQLLRAFKGGDATAFTELVNLHQAALPRVTQERRLMQVHEFGERGRVTSLERPQELAVGWAGHGLASLRRPERRRCEGSWRYSRPPGILPSR